MKGKTNRIIRSLLFLLASAGMAKHLSPESLALTKEGVNQSIVLQDIQGQSRTPLKTDQANGSILFFVTHDCPISNAYSPELTRLRNEFSSKGFQLTLVYVDPDVTADGIKQHMKDYSLEGYTAISDKKHVLVKEAGATITPEVAVIANNGTISYRGRIDNMYPALGQRRRIITERDLRNVLNSIVDNKSIPITRTKAVGCYMPNI